jgi:protein-S-isoprenylcysteine O-methyltransferase Ste14
MTGYGLWPLVVINTAVVLLIGASFFHPASKRDWRVFGGFSAFVVALFAEMYGAPLTIYLLSGWLGSSFLGLDLTHDGGHLWAKLIGWQGDPHLSPFHIAGYAGLIGGFWLISAAWRRLYSAARCDRLATDGPYRHVRHPQYVGFAVIMIGFLLQWPTLPTLIMFPVLVLVYRRLAVSEEREVRSRFEATWDAYAAATPRFVPRRRRAAAQDALVIVKSGYHPDVVTARAGAPVLLRFRREESAPCSDTVLLPTLGRFAQLPEGETVSLYLPALEPGDYEFRCGRDVLHGRLLVA